MEIDRRNGILSKDNSQRNEQNQNSRQVYKENIVMERPMIEVKRASEKTIKALIEKGIIYIGNDNQLHVKEIIPMQPTKAHKGIRKQ